MAMQLFDVGGAGRIAAGYGVKTAAPVARQPYLFCR